MTLEEHNNLRKQKESENKKEIKDFLERLEKYNRNLDYLHGYDDCRKECEEKLRWIPVEEKLPEKQGHYLVKAPKSFPKNCIVVVAEFY